MSSNIGTPVSQESTNTEMPDASSVEAPKDTSTQTSQPAEPAKESGAAPWAKDLADMGLDPDTLGKVDGYLRTSWQPRMTKFEQDLAGWSKPFGGDLEGAQTAASFFASLDSDPAGTLANLESVLREQGLLGDASNSPYESDDDGMDDPADETTPEQEWTRQQMQAQKDKEENDHYEGVLNELADEKFPGLDRDLFTTFVIANQGNLDGAIAAYTPYHKAPDPTPTAPDTAGGSTTPAPREAKRPASLKDAISDWQSESRTARGR